MIQKVLLRCLCFDILTSKIYVLGMIIFLLKIDAHLISFAKGPCLWHHNYVQLNNIEISHFTIFGAHWRVWPSVHKQINSVLCA